MAGLLISTNPGADLVAATLRAWARAPFEWGKTDCGLSVLAYVELAVGRKAAPAPQHRDRKSAIAMLRAAGGMTAFCSSVMAALGCTRTDQPARGDVGLVRLPGSGLTACLCLGDRWAARADREIIVVRLAPRCAWSVTCPKP